MTVAAGTRLGSYEVLAPIGAGGMGEVYRAHDTKLGRDVAIKVLPEAVAHDPERLSRFQREAKVLASLNHPNIGTIYGLEQANGTSYLVMELVTGENLAERIKREGGRDGAVAIEEALTIARQIAEALEAAHEKGIVHRDLKPANVKVTPEGTVKVLDFGLAKALADEPASEDVSKSPTLSMAATRLGVILGTAAYMSPEQAKGKPVDRRADVWAFGAVLYETLTGQAAFHGEDVTEILAAVVRAEPDWNRLPANTPATIRTLLRRCLAKDVRQRLQHIGEARFALEHAGDAPAEPVVVEGGGAFGRRGLLLAVGCLLVGIIIAGLAVWNLKPKPARPAQPVLRVVVPLPPNEQLTRTLGTMLALSVDGTQLAYVAGSSQRIYLRAFDTAEAKPLTGTEGAASPFFSSDGQWIGFFAVGKLKKVSVSGGAVLTLCDAPNSRGGAWGANDTIVFASSNVGILSQVSAAGGAPQPLTKLKESELSHRWPQFLPDGKTILYAISNGSYDDTQIAVYRLNTGEQKVLIRGGTYPWYVPTGHLVYYRAGTIMAVPFDTVRLAVLGTPAPVIEGVMSSIGDTLGAQFSISSRGSLVYVPGKLEGGAEATLVWVDRKGSAQLLPASPHAYANPSLSPDGRQVAMDITEAGKQAIWIYDLVRDTLTRLTFEGLNSFPVWTPDGKRVAYKSQRVGGFNIYWTPADGSGAEERLTTTAGGANTVPSSFSPDGRALIYSQTGPETSWDLWMLPMQGERKPQTFLQTPSNERSSRLSPDGRWLAYASDESGRYEAYVRPFPGPGGKWQVSTDGAAEITWSPKGNELFYRTGEQREKVMVVDIQTQPAFSAGKPRQLFEGPYLSGVANGSWTANYSIAPDSQRFLMLKPKEQQQQTALTQINVVQNWSEELKQKAPTGKK